MKSSRGFACELADRMSHASSAKPAKSAWVEPADVVYACKLLIYVVGEGPCQEGAVSGCDFSFRLGEPQRVSRIEKRCGADHHSIEVPYESEVAPMSIGVREDGIAHYHFGHVCSKFCLVHPQKRGVSAKTVVYAVSTRA